MIGSTDVNNDSSAGKNFIREHVNVGDADRPIHGFKSYVSEENCYRDTVDRL